jgi:hypothetical protein
MNSVALKGKAVSAPLVEPVVPDKQQENKRRYQHHLKRKSCWTPVDVNKSPKNPL